MALSEVYYNGTFGVPADQPEALRWVRLAAEQGFSDAMLFLGMSYDTGLGVPQDPAEGVRWYRKAAEAGDSTGALVLGSAYAAGRGVERDARLSVAWWEKAAREGVAEAQYRLGLAYDTGFGVIQDDREARRWYWLAAEQSHQSAQELLIASYLGRESEVRIPAAAYVWAAVVSTYKSEMRRDRDTLASILSSEELQNARELARTIQQAMPPPTESGDSGQPDRIAVTRAREVVAMGSGVSPPKLVSMPRPEYPPRALRRKADEDVVLVLLVDEIGEVEDITLERGADDLALAAINAAKKAYFAPARSGSDRVRMRYRLTVPFRY